jgi:hypothetical protein
LPEFLHQNGDMVKTVTNEGRCCDAVLRILEAEHGERRRDVVRDTPSQPGIEVSCYIGNQHYAIEHTLIEPFPENQRDDILFGRVFDPAFETAIADLLKPGLVYTITVNVYAFYDFTGKRLAAVRAALLAWARGAVPHLPEPPREHGPTEVRIHAGPPEAPVRVTLACHYSTALGGRLLPGRFAPQDLESLRQTRLLKALQDKGPKLHAASAGNTRTILIVENHDFAITNEGLVSEAFDQLSAQVQHPPSDIYLVDTRGGRTFRVTQVRRARHACLLMGEKLGDWEYTAAELQEL